jgi:hypothetical protein
MITRALTIWLMLGIIAAAVLCPQASAAGSPPRPPAAFAPSIVEWFSAINPRPGKHMFVYARFVNNNKPVPGARLTVTLRLGAHSLGTVHGTMTGRKGIARAAFTVPASAGGKSLRVVTTLSYKGQKYQGRNDLKVRA